MPSACRESLGEVDGGAEAEAGAGGVDERGVGDVDGVDGRALPLEDLHHEGDGGVGGPPPVGEGGGGAGGGGSAPGGRNEGRGSSCGKVVEKKPLASFNSKGKKI